MEFHARAPANLKKLIFCHWQHVTIHAPLLNELGHENIVVCFLTQDIDQQKETLSGDIECWFNIYTYAEMTFTQESLTKAPNYYNRIEMNDNKTG